MSRVISFRELYIVCMYNVAVRERVYYYTYVFSYDEMALSRVVLYIDLYAREVVRYYNIRFCFLYVYIYIMRSREIQKSSETIFAFVRVCKQS